MIPESRGPNFWVKMPPFDMTNWQVDHYNLPKEVVFNAYTQPTYPTPSQTTHPPTCPNSGIIQGLLTIGFPLIRSYESLILTSPSFLQMPSDTLIRFCKQAPADTISSRCRSIHQGHAASFPLGWKEVGESDVFFF